MVSDGIMHIFGVGTPSEDKLSKVIRTEIIKEAAESGTNLIFTYVWNFAREKGKGNIDHYKSLYEERGGEVQFVELGAPLDVRVARADSPERRRLKAHAPDAKRVAYLEEAMSLKSPSPFYYPEVYSYVDTTGKTPDEIANEVIALL